MNRRERFATSEISCDHLEHEIVAGDSRIPLIIVIDIK